jgi:hypothetical protein
VRTEPRAGGRNLYPALRRLRLGAVGLAVSSALLAIGIAGGLAGEQNFFENPMTILTWVDFWVGLGIVSALVGNVWDAASPLSAVGRWLERRFAMSGTAVLRYPEWLGIWPATVLVLVWTWLELVWAEAREPRSLAILALVYVGVTLVGMAAYGTETWLARCELFTVFARTLARFAPLELYSTDEEGREHVGRPDLWHAAPPERRAVRLRPYGAGVRRDPPLGAGGGAFVVALLATVVYDGFSQTLAFADVEAWFLERSGWLAAHDTALQTLLMVGVVVLFVLAYVVVAWLVSLREPGGAAAVARRYAPTLVPIAAVYFVAHYFLYLVYLGQLTWKAVADPFGRGWVDGYAPWADVPGGVVWYVQVTLIVWGHVVAVLAAHRVALDVEGSSPRTALVAQLPLVLLMVGYTFTGLWVLGQTLIPE